MKSMRSLIFVYLLFSTPFLQACAPSSTPNDRTLQGEWSVEFHTEIFGSFRTVMTFDAEEDGFEAHSPRGGTNVVLGFFKGTLARWTSGRTYEKGALLHFLDGELIDDSDTGNSFKATMKTPMDDFSIKGTFKDSVMSGRFFDSEGEPMGRFEGHEGVDTLPMEDYPKLFDEMKSLTRSKVFDPSELEKEGWKEFEEEIKDVAGDARDDLEFLFALFLNRSKLPFSHYSIFKKGDPDLDENEERDADEGNSQVIRSKAIRDSIDYLEIPTFSISPDKVDSAISPILDKGSEHLILDLRNNSGGSLSAMRVAEYFIDSVQYGGIFLTNRWFSDHDSIPPLSSYPSFRILKDADTELLLDGISKERGVVLRVEPRERSFQGKLYLLTSEGTASACEPLVHGLKRNPDVSVIGERTAGQMLNGERFSVKGGWMLVVPTADFYTTEGKRLEGNGVPPDHDVEAEKALNYTLKHFFGIEEGDDE